MGLPEETNVSNVLFSAVWGVVVVFLLSYFWKRRWLYYYGSKIDGPSLLESLQFLINGREMFLQNLTKMVSKYKPIGKIWLGPRLYIFISEPEYIECAMKQCIARDDLYRMATPTFGNGLLTAPPKIWKAHRKIINQTFNQTILNSYIDIFVKHSEIMNKFLKENKGVLVDMFPVFYKSNFGIICDSCLGVNSADWNKQNEYMVGLQRGVDLATKRLYNPLFLSEVLWNWFGSKKEVLTLSSQAFETVEKILKTKRQDDVDIFCQKDFLSYLIRVTDEEKKWSNKELIDETQTMIVGGSETSTITLSFVALMLGMHQEVQENVYQELCSIFGDSDRPATLSDLDQMIYFERVIKETMRLFPVGPLLLRTADKHIPIGNIVIPKDATLMIPTAYVHRDPTIWKNPLNFDPNRFLPEETEKRARYAHMPFGVPPRNCIGMKFAMMAMKVLLSGILRNFKIVSAQYNSIESIKLEIKILITAANGYAITLESR